MSGFRKIIVEEPLITTEERPCVASIGCYADEINNDSVIAALKARETTNCWEIKIWDSEHGFAEIETEILPVFVDHDTDQLYINDVCCAFNYHEMTMDECIRRYFEMCAYTNYKAGLTGYMNVPWLPVEGARRSYTIKIDKIKAMEYYEAWWTQAHIDDKQQAVNAVLLEPEIIYLGKVEQ